MWNKDTNKQLKVIFPETLELDPVRDMQRAFYTTWSMNVEVLSPLATNLLRTVSMVGNAPIYESFMESIGR